MTMGLMSPDLQGHPKGRGFRRGSPSSLYLKYLLLQETRFGLKTFNRLEEAMADLTASSQDAEVPAPSMTVLGAGSLRVNEVTGGAQIRHDPCLWRKGHARTQRDGIHPRAEERGRGRSGTHWRLAPGLPAPEP